MNQTNLTILLVSLAIVFVVGSQSIFTVDQREQALVLQLGNPVGEPRGPGLHFKLPLVQEVRIFDRRILSVDPAPEQVVISSATFNKTTEEGEEQQDDFSNISGEPIIVDSFARYKITDPLQFLKTLGTIGRANSRLENILNDATRSVLGQTTLRELLSEERTAVMASIKSRVNKKTQEDKLGVKIVDVRIVRADLTAELRTSTVRRMISELQERATETRAKGEERAKEIRSTAEKERTVILAEAERDAQIIRGEGDNQAIKIYAEAFNKDKEFYGFIRSMEAYRNTLADSETRLILSPDSDFFRYFEGR
ncbi:MAG: protease modulator HflC [Alphaproteobacteria bacterium]|nr:protease modulator HflC [Alphaproteobacteria bacterium]